MDLEDYYLKIIYVVDLEDYLCYGLRRSLNLFWK